MRTNTRLCRRRKRDSCHSECRYACVQHHLVAVAVSRCIDQGRGLSSSCRAIPERHAPWGVVGSEARALHVTMDDAVIAVEAQGAIAYQPGNSCKGIIRAGVDTVLGDIRIIEADAPWLDAQVIECFVVHRAIAVDVLRPFDCAEHSGEYRDIVERHAHRSGCFAE